MMIYMFNHETQILDLTRLMMVLQKIHKTLKILNILQFKYLMITTDPPRDLQKNGVEQTTEPDQNYDNHENEIPQQTSDYDQNTQKTQKDTNISSDDDTQKTPENSQNTPL